MSVKNTHISRLDWDAHETSWDFRIHPLLETQESELAKAFQRYKNLWTEQFFRLHENEETLNRQFIEIYGLQDELDPFVPLEDITILQDELDRKALAALNPELKRDPETGKVLNYRDIELPFLQEEVMAQFISYAVGCMFGRYSPDKEGLILAGQGEKLEDYFRLMGKTREECTFLPDADGVIPILDDEWFTDDITGRFYQFLKVVFGEQHYVKNLQFIEKQMGKDIRKYFLKDFYTDHVQRYKKRPIYWMFSSPKGVFNALIYLHRYTSDTPHHILNRYLREYMGKLGSRRDSLRPLEISGDSHEQAAAVREIDRIGKQLTELEAWEREVMFPVAIDRIQIDLDEGVLVNYNKFGRAVREIPGLNDDATRKKVEQFEWRRR